MATNEFSNLSAIQKYVYQPGDFDKLYRSKHEFYKNIITETKPYTGKAILVPVRPDTISGYGNRQEQEQLPPGGILQGQFAQINVVYQYMVGNLSGQSKETMKGGASSVVDVYTDLMSQMLEGAVSRYNFDLYRTSLGLIATVTSATNNGYTVTVDNIYGLHYGESYDIYTASDFGANAVIQVSNNMITNINEITNVVTFQTSLNGLGATTGSMIFRAGDYANGINRSLNGLLDNLAYVTSSTTLFGIDKNLNFWWNGNLINSTVGPMTDRVMQQLDLSASINEVNPKMWLTDPTTKSYIWQDIILPSKMTVEFAEIAGGHTTFKYNGKVIVDEVAVPLGYMFDLDPANFTLYDCGDFDWLTDDGGKLHQVQGYDAFTLTLRRYSNLYCKAPRKCPYSYGITG